MHLEYLPLLENLQMTTQYMWGLVVLGYLYNDLCNAVERGRTNATGCVVLLHVHVLYINIF